MYLDVYVGLYLNGDKFRLINVDWKTQLSLLARLTGGGETAYLRRRNSISQEYDILWIQFPWHHNICEAT